jgi:hypothetical protein
MSEAWKEQPAEPMEESGGAAEERADPFSLPPGCIGKVCAPLQQEATSQEFYFWHPDDRLVERTQIVTVENEVGGEMLTHYGIVDEVFRSSRARSIGHERDEHDGRLDARLPFESEGFNYARVTILRVRPNRLAPPRDRTNVCLATEADVALAYAADEIRNGLGVGLVKNGGERLAGPGIIDLDYLLGKYGAHLLVNGAAGRAAKSSFLMHLVYLLLQRARREGRDFPGREDRLKIVPIVFNVKNFDLFHIDCPNREWAQRGNSDEWRLLGVEEPGTFLQPTFYAPQVPEEGATVAQPTGRAKNDVKAYSWSLKDVIAEDLFSYLFAEVDSSDANFSVLAQDVENLLTKSLPRLDNGKEVNTFSRLIQWIDEQIRTKEENRSLRNHAPGTWRKFYRRLLLMVQEGSGVLRSDDEQGRPLKIAGGETCDPIVIDLNWLSGQPELQRFVVATVLRQLKEARRGANALSGLRYLIVLDELNRFAPRGARDAVTRLIEEVAAEMRSQGVILLGAQQQASRVSEKVVANAGVTVLGRTSAVELTADVWRGLSASARRKAENLRNDEKLIVQDTCPEPMHVKIPFPAWAMNREEAEDTPGNADGAHLESGNIDDLFLEE